MDFLIGLFVGMGLSQKRGCPNVGGINLHPVLGSLSEDPFEKQDKPKPDPRPVPTPPQPPDTIPGE